MITEEDKKRIKIEEIFRAEIRESFKKTGNEPFRKKAWNLLNSPFGLWMLSTVVVGLVVYFYNDIKMKGEISSNNASTIHKLSTEANYRLQKFRLSLSQQNEANLYYEDTELAYMIDGTLINDGSLSPEKPIYIFPEFKERTMHSLLYEMERLTKDKKQASSIKEARNILSKIRNKLLDLEERPKLEFSRSQHVSSIVQSQPANLTPQDSLILAEYLAKRKKFEQGELSEYHNRIKLSLDSLTNTFLSNSFLKSISNQ
jgi:hypothetical protein